MKYFIIMLLLVSCAPYKVEHTGTVKVEINVDNLKKYFEVKCKQELSPDVAKCVDLKVADFLDTLSSTGITPSP